MTDDIAVEPVWARRGTLARGSGGPVRRGRQAMRTPQACDDSWRCTRPAGISRSVKAPARLDPAAAAGKSRVVHHDRLRLARPVRERDGEAPRGSRHVRCTTAGIACRRPPCRQRPSRSSLDPGGPLHPAEDQVVPGRTAPQGSPSRSTARPASGSSTGSSHGAQLTVSRSRRRPLGVRTPPGISPITMFQALRSAT